MEWEQLILFDWVRPIIRVDRVYTHFLLRQNMPFLELARVRSGAPCSPKPRSCSPAPWSQDSFLQGVKTQHLVLWMAWGAGSGSHTPRTTFPHWHHLPGTCLLSSLLSRGRSPRPARAGSNSTSHGEAAGGRREGRAEPHLARSSSLPCAGRKVDAPPPEQSVPPTRLREPAKPPRPAPRRRKLRRRAGQGRATAGGGWRRPAPLRRGGWGRRWWTETGKTHRRDCPAPKAIAHASARLPRRFRGRPERRLSAAAPRQPLQPGSARRQPPLTPPW